MRIACISFGMRRSATVPISAFRLSNCLREMKKGFLLLLVLMCAGLVRAQGTGAQAPVPAGKIAVIYSDAFQDPTNGIARFAAVINKLNAEFKPIQDDLSQTAARLRTMQDEINKLQQGTPAATPQQIQAKVDQFDDQKKAYDRK